MQIEIICVHRNRCVFELDDDFHAFALGARRKIQQRMFVETQLSEDAIKPGRSGFGHRGIVKQGRENGCEDTMPPLATAGGTPVLLVAQCLDGIQPRSLDRWQHTADDANET